MRVEGQARFSVESYCVDISSEWRSIALQSSSSSSLSSSSSSAEPSSSSSLPSPNATIITKHLRELKRLKYSSVSSFFFCHKANKCHPEERQKH
ncbi:unnamed protein product [Wuchereria bancrofti]|uniref:Uncharacterized protein n=1 Tax=Wuchereria bancrofti TaxID=6293 RepID=A0A3P7EJH3_WUCBA|nr:unnamed protein product [Wuchereria bancrofti]